MKSTYINRKDRERKNREEGENEREVKDNFPKWNEVWGIWHERLQKLTAHVTSKLTSTLIIQKHTGE